jgi:hypothetical protein
MTDDCRWATFWPARDCRERSLQAAQDARALADERFDELISALWTYAINDDVSAEESLASVGLGSIMVNRIVSAYPQGGQS